MFQDITAGLTHEQEGVTITANRDRRLQLDVDGVCYHVAKPDTLLESNIKSLLNYIDQLRQCAGAGTVYTHTTLKLKGGREFMATVKPYQEKRHGYHNPNYLQRVRDLRQSVIYHETQLIKPAPQLFIEADDSMTMAHLDYIRQTGDPTLSVIGTDDKDLWQNPGNIINITTKKTTWNGTWDSMQRGWGENLGWVAFRASDKSKTKKLVGRGMKFFWAQMLAGDSADNIAGLPAIATWVADIYKPIKGNRTAEQLAVGDSLAADMISQARSEADCFNMVHQAYASYYGVHAMFYIFESAFALWLRRTNNVLDVLEYFKQLGVQYTLHEQQVAALHEYQRQCQEVARTWGK